MKLSRVLVVLVSLLFTACGLTDQQKADYARVQASGVSPAVYDKMMNGDGLSPYDVKALTRAHVSDGIILRYMRDHETVYFLNSADVTSLRNAGVSQSIVDYMLQTPHMYGPNYYPSIGVGYGPYWGNPYWGAPYPYPYYRRHW